MMPSFFHSFLHYRIDAAQNNDKIIPEFILGDEFYGKNRSRYPGYDPGKQH